MSQATRPLGLLCSPAERATRCRVGATSTAPSLGNGTPSRQPAKVHKSLNCSLIHHSQWFTVLPQATSRMVKSLGQVSILVTPSPPHATLGLFWRAAANAPASATAHGRAGSLAAQVTLLSLHSSSEVTCPLATPPRHGSLEVKVRGRVVKPTALSLGAEVHFTCKKHFWLDGEAVVSCTKKGRLSGAVPLCQPLPCSSPPM